MRKQAMSLPMELVVIAIIVLIFIVVASIFSSKIPEWFKKSAESPFDDVCCCKAEASKDCSVIIKQDCLQKKFTVKPIEDCSKKS